MVVPNQKGVTDMSEAWLIALALVLALDIIRKLI
jgi:hypothetical protein